jgi:hypothetical protein
MTVVPHPPSSPDCDFSVSLHFDIFEVIEAEAQAMLNTRTEHDFQNALEKL